MLHPDDLLRSPERWKSGELPSETSRMPFLRDQQEQNMWCSVREDSRCRGPTLQFRSHPCDKRIPLHKREVLVDINRLIIVYTQAAYLVVSLLKYERTRVGDFWMDRSVPTTALVSCSGPVMHCFPTALFLRSFHTRSSGFSSGE